MPLYDFQCMDCETKESRIAGLDDHMALCSMCGGLMLRLNENVLRTWFSPDQVREEVD